MHRAYTTTVVYRNREHQLLFDDGVRNIWVPHAGNYYRAGSNFTISLNTDNGPKTFTIAIYDGVVSSHSRAYKDKPADTDGDIDED